MKELSNKSNDRPASDDSMDEEIAKAKDEADKLLKNANSIPVEVESKFARDLQLSVGKYVCNAGEKAQRRTRSLIMLTWMGSFSKWKVECTLRVYKK